MSVKQFENPSFTEQDAATYKVNIDSSIAVVGNVAAQFAPRELPTPAMGIHVEEGLLMDGSVIASQQLGGIGAPVELPRIDRVYLDLNTKTLKRAVGTEAESPAVPGLPYGVFPVCQLYLEPGQTTITNAHIIDDRTMVMAPVAFVESNYVNMVDADGLLRLIIGRGGYDNRIIARLQTADATSSFQIQAADGTPLFSVDGTGAVKAAGTVTGETEV